MPVRDAFKAIAVKSLNNRGEDPSVIDDKVLDVLLKKYNNNVKDYMKAVYQKEGNDPNLITDEVVNVINKKFGIEGIPAIPVKKKEKPTSQTLGELSQTSAEPLLEDEVIPDFEEKLKGGIAVKDETPGFFSSVFRSISSGLIKTGAGLVEAMRPFAGYTMSAPGMGASTRMLKRNSDNELVPITDDDIKKTQAETQRIATKIYNEGVQLTSKIEKFDKGIWDSILSGNLIDAGKQTAYGMSESLGAMIPMAINAPVGIGMLGVSATGQKDLEMRGEMAAGKAKYTEGQIVATSLAFGAGETFVDMATSGLFKMAGNTFNTAYKKFGKKGVEEATSGFLKQMVKGSGKEIPGEVATQISQNIADKYIAGKDVDILDGVADSIIVSGAFGSTTIGGSYASGMALGRLSSEADKKIVGKNNEKINEIGKQKEDPNLTTEQVEALENVQRSLMQENTDIIVKSTAIVNNMTDEQKTSMNELSKSIESIDNLLQAGNLSPETIDVLLSQKNSLNKNKQDILNAVQEQIDTKIEADEKQISELQKKVDYLKKEGEPYKELSIDEIEQRYKELSEAKKKDKAKVEPTPTPAKTKETVAKEKIETEKAKALEDLETRFKDPQTPMTKAEYRKEKKAINLKFEEDAKKIGKEPEKPVQEKRDEQREVQQVRVRDDEKAGLETQRREEKVEPTPTEVKTEEEVETEKPKYKGLGKKAKELAQRPTQKPKYKEVVDQYAGLKKQIQLESKSAKAAEKFTADKATENISRVKEFIKENQTKLTPRQYESIINRLRKGAVNEKQLQNTLDYVEKAIGDVKYAQRFQVAQSIKNQLKKKIKTVEFKKNFAQQMPLIREFANLNPNVFSPDELPNYNRIVYDIVKGKINPDAARLIEQYAKEKRVVSPIEQSIKAAKDVNAINDVLYNAEKDIANVSDLDSYKAQTRNINSIRNKSAKLLENGDITVDEFNAIQDRIEKLETRTDDSADRTLEDAAEDIKNTMYNEIEDNKSFIDKNTLIEGLKEVYDNLSSLTREQMLKLPLSMANKLNNAIYNLSNGVETRDLMTVDNYIKQQNIKEKGIDTVSEKVFNTEFKDVEKITRDTDKLRDKLNLKNAYFWDDVLGMGKTKEIYTKILKPIIQASTRAEIRRKRATSDFNKALNKYNSLKFRGKQQGLDMVGILLLEKRYRANPIKIENKTYKWEDLPQEYKNKHGYILSNQNYTDKISVEQRDRIQKAYDNLSFDENGILDINGSINNLPKQTKALMDEAVKSFEDIKDLNRYNAIKAGELWVDSKEYVPEYVIQEVLGQKYEGESKTIQNETEKAFNQPFKTTTKLSGAIYEKSNRIFVNETDISKIVNRHARQTTHDAYVNTAYTNVNTALRNSMVDLEAKPMGNAYKAVSALRQAVRDNVIHAYADKVYKMDEISKATAYMNRYARYRLLTKIARVPAELISNIYGAVIDHGINPLSIANLKLNRKFAVLIEDMGSPLINKTSRYSEMQDPNETGRMQKIADWIVSASDQAVSQPIFIKEFKKRFQQLTGEKFDINRYLADKEYRDNFKDDIDESTSFGEVAVSEQYNTLSEITAATKTKYVPFGKTVDINNPIAKTLSFMMSFNTQEAEIANKALRQIRRGNYKQGATLLTSRIGRNVIYSIVRQAATYGLLASITGDDEKEEKLKEVFTPNTLANSVASGIGSLVVGRYGNVFKPMAGSLLGFMEAYEKELGSDGEATKNLQQIINYMQYTKPIRKYGNAYQIIGSFIPAQAVFLEDMGDAAWTFGEMSIKAIQGEDWTDDEMLMYNIGAATSAIITAVAPNPFTPYLRDLAKSVAYDIKKERKAAKKSGGFKKAEFKSTSGFKKAEWK